MVRAKDSNEFGSVPLNQVQVLINGVGGALIPILTHAHLGRNGRDKVIAKEIRGAPYLFEMLQQRLRLELGQNINGKDAGVHKIGKHKVNNSVPASKRHSGLGSVCRQGIETLAPATREDNAQDVHHRTSVDNLLNARAVRTSCCRLEPSDPRKNPCALPGASARSTIFFRQKRSMPVQGSSIAPEARICQRQNRYCDRARRRSPPRYLSIRRFPEPGGLYHISD